MIKAEIYRNKSNRIYGFKVVNHGESKVCSAVSILTQNTANSIEEFTDCHIKGEYDEKNGGFFVFEVEDIKIQNEETQNADCHDAELLLKAMVFGLKCIENEYRKDIKVIDKGGAI